MTDKLQQNFSVPVIVLATLIDYLWTIKLSQSCCSKSSAAQGLLLDCKGIATDLIVLDSYRSKGLAMTNTLSEILMRLLKAQTA